MPCAHPFPANRHPKGGRVLLGKAGVREILEDGYPILSELMLPCGSCVGCQITRAREWAIRCELEQQLHLYSCFVTLTYSESNVPPTLSRDDLSLFFRYLRRRVGRFRFFGCGEYGDRTERPHYHAVLFGTQDAEAVQGAWGKGFATVAPVNPARISYTVGYCAKKIGYKVAPYPLADADGVYLGDFQPPFQKMSRKPGLGGDARKHWRSWRRTAVWSGREVPVPRFLHASYRENASESELAALELEKLEARMVPTIRDLQAAEAIARSRVRLRSERSQL